VTYPCNALEFPDGTPERALVDILTASKPETVERHLPESIRSALRTLSASERRAFEEKLLVGKIIQLPGSQVEVPEDGHALLVRQSANSEESSELRVQRELIGGADAVLQLVIVAENPNNQEALVWMHFEDGEWRITELQWLGFRSSRFVVDDPAFIEQFRRPEQKEAEAAAVGILYQLHWALASYVHTYPETGLPYDLAVLGHPESESSEASGEPDDISDYDLRSADHASLMANTMAANQFESDGYVFQYELRLGGPEGEYSIIARPKRYGEVTTRSFYLDQSGRIRGTGENREPTVDDDPVD
jgi:hypothetical protein